jgi:hypothetical protein
MFKLLPTLKALAAVTLVAGACAAPAPTSPPPQPPLPPGILFRADYAREAYPALGFGGAETEHEGTRFTRTYLPTGGPQGQPAVRLAAKPCPGCSSSGGQYNWGNRGNIVPTDARDGESRFYRWRARFDGNHRGLGWEDGASGGMQNKFLIVGQGCGRDCRVILSYQTGDRGIRNFRLQKDGGDDHVDTDSYPNGKWLDIQVEIAPAPGNDGAFRLWIDNGRQDKPTGEQKKIPLHGTNARYVWLGAFMNDGLAGDGSHNVDLTDFEIGTAFDPTWDRP